MLGIIINAKKHKFFFGLQPDSKSNCRACNPKLAPADAIYVLNFKKTKFLFSKQAADAVFELVNAFARAAAEIFQSLVPTGVGDGLDGGAGDGVARRRSASAGIARDFSELKGIRID